MKAATRVLVVYGSETNQTYSEMKALVEDWEAKAEKKMVTKLLEGNKAADIFDEINSKNYDMLVIGTSSYGDGDAPTGFGKFLYQLYEAAKNPDKPLQGLQHCILGCGSTVYYTFQNVPRIADKLLEQAGSRRCLKRVEIDEVEDFEDNKKLIKKWGDDVFDFATTVGVGGKDEKAVCKWNDPKGTIYNKKLGPDGYDAEDDQQGSMVRILLAAAVAVGAYYYYFIYQKQLEAESS